MHCVVKTKGPRPSSEIEAESLDSGHSRKLRRIVDSHNPFAASVCPGQMLCAFYTIDARDGAAGK